ncbi:hypothetical protein FKM82_027663, partial [Ascaphus truei]
SATRDVRLQRQSQVGRLGRKERNVHRGRDGGVHQTRGGAEREIWMLTQETHVLRDAQRLTYCQHEGES